MEILNAVALLALATWMYAGYRKTRHIDKDNMLRASQTLLWLAVGMFFWVSLLIWGIQ